jgi:hypothetical protein
MKKAAAGVLSPSGGLQVFWSAAQKLLAGSSRRLWTKGRPYHQEKRQKQQKTDRPQKGDGLSYPLGKLDLLAGRLSQNGQAVLDTEPFNLSVPQLAAVANKLAPRGGQGGIGSGGYHVRRYERPCSLAHWLLR